jgi:hypothetical protein
VGVIEVEIVMRDGNTILLSPERVRRLASWLLASETRGATSMASQLRAAERDLLARSRIVDLTASEDAALFAALAATR